jgi:putative transposase
VQVKEPLMQPLTANECWNMSFMSDNIMDGSKLRVLNVIDDYNRQYLGFDNGRSLPAPRFIRALDGFLDFNGKPKRIRMDNGPEYTSHHMQLWAIDKEIELQFIQPDKPTQNSYIECFNRTYRTEVLNSYLFSSLYEVHETTKKFQHNYYYNRPHGSLNDLPPVELKDHRNNIIAQLKNNSIKRINNLT